MVVVLAVLVAVVAVVALWWNVREARAPVLDEVRVVFRPAGAERATTDPPMVPAGVEVEVAALVTYHRGEGGDPTTVCGLRPVEVDGELVDAADPSTFPASGGVLRALWYSVEPSLFGWQDVGPDGSERLAYADFAAIEMGRDLVTTVSWESHNDDFVSDPPPGNLLPGGVRRIKVRVAAYANENEIVPLQSVSSPGAEDVFTGRVPTVVRQVDALDGLDPAVARFLRLGCFTFTSEAWPDGGPGWGLDLTPAELVANGYVTTPETFAAAAAVGAPLETPWSAPVPLSPTPTGWTTRGGRVLRWGADVDVGDVLRGGGQVAVLVGDDGDGVLSLGDRAAWAWREPAQVGPVGPFLAEVDAVELLRRGAEE